MREEVKFMVKVTGATAYMAVSGRPTYLNCRCAADFLNAVLEKGCAHVVLDFANCTGMDSTFLGMIAGIALKLNKTGGDVTMLNLNERNRELVDNLGIFKLVKIGESQDQTGGASELQCSGSASYANILGAHENLIEADSSNLSKLEDVITFMKKDGDLYK